jgi:ADP-ribose pyrophosphatase YjhB (NUDIX family)
MHRQKELAELGAIYGEPLLRRCTRDVSEATFRFWKAKSKKRFGEVVLFILRANGRLLLHTKAFYPEGVFRLPSGTLLEGERLLDAVRRETREETGLQVRVEHFLAVLEFEFRWQGQSLLIPSYLFLVREVQGTLHCEDGKEQICAFREISPCELIGVAEQLEHMSAEWQDWGWFRSIPHRIAAQLLPSWVERTP